MSTETLIVREEPDYDGESLEDRERRRTTTTHSQGPIHVERPVKVEPLNA